MFFFNPSYSEFNSMDVFTRLDVVLSNVKPVENLEISYDV